MTDTMDLGLAALTGQPHYLTGAVESTPLTPGSVLLGIGVAACGIAAVFNKKGKKHKAHKKWKTDLPLRPTPEQVQSVYDAARNLRGEDRQRALELLEVMTPEEVYRYIRGLEQFIQDNRPPLIRRQEALKELWPAAPVGAFRGMMLSSRHPVVRAKPGEVVDLRTKPGRKGLSSWTEELKVAREFVGEPTRHRSPVIVECVGAPSGQALLMPPSRSPSWFEKLLRGSTRRWMEEEVEIRPGPRSLKFWRKRLARKDKSILKMPASEVRELAVKEMARCRAKNLFDMRARERECVMKAPVTQVRVVEVRRWSDPEQVQVRVADEVERKACSAYRLLKKKGAGVRGLATAKAEWLKAHKIFRAARDLARKSYAAKTKAALTERAAREASERTARVLHRPEGVEEACV